MAQVILTFTSPCPIHLFTLRLFTLSLLANENPYLSNAVSDPHSGEPRIPQQEVLLTLQDWLWHKLITIFGMYKLDSIYGIVNYSFSPDRSEEQDDFKVAGLKKRILDCGSDYFDANGQSPFSYIQNLLVIGEYEKSILYLLQRHWLISAVFLSFLMYAYGVVSGSENVFVTSILRLLPHMTEKPTIPVHLIAFVKEPSVKLDLLVVGNEGRIESRSFWLILLLLRQN